MVKRGAKAGAPTSNLPVPKASTPKVLEFLGCILRNTSTLLLLLFMRVIICTSSYRDHRLQPGQNLSIKSDAPSCHTLPNCLHFCAGSELVEHLILGLESKS